MPAPRPPAHPTPSLRPALACLVLLALVLAGCGGDEPGASDDVAATEPDAPDATPATGAVSDGGSDEGPDEGPESEPESEPDEEPGQEPAPAGEGPAAGVDGCPATTELSVTLVRTDGEEEVLPATAFPAGHFVLDLDGSGFGPILAGAMSTDVAADAVAVGESWASPATPAAGQAVLSVQLQGPAAGETTYPLGPYGQTEADGVVAPTEGMGLATLSLLTPDGSSRTAARDNVVELTHLGDGVICGTISPSDREPAQSNPVTHVEGAFAATLAEQP
jgi:hypothetical protein